MLKKTKIFIAIAIFSISNINAGQDLDKTTKVYQNIISKLAPRQDTVEEVNLNKRLQNLREIFNDLNAAQREKLLDLIPEFVSLLKKNKALTITELQRIKEYQNCKQENEQKKGVQFIKDAALKRKYVNDIDDHCNNLFGMSSKKYAGHIAQSSQIAEGLKKLLNTKRGASILREIRDIVEFNLPDNVIIEKINNVLFQ